MTNAELREMHFKYMDRDPEFDRDIWEKYIIIREQVLKGRAYDFLKELQ